MFHVRYVKEQCYHLHLPRHLAEQHHESRSKYSVTCVDPIEAIFMVSKTTDGLQYPIHVQNKNFGQNMAIQCEEELCMIAKAMAHDAGNVSWLCHHILATQDYDHTNYKEIELLECKLDEIVGKKIYSNMKKEMCKELYSSCDYHPFIIQHCLKEASTDRYKYFSVFSNKQSYYSKFGRIIITYDSNESTLTSKCCKRRSFCVHKCTVLWFLYQQYGFITTIKDEF